MKIAITGSNGYIGSHLVALARRRRISVVHLTRNAPALEATEQWLPFDLTRPACVTLPPDVDAVIHLAINPGAASATDSANEVRAAGSLIDAAEAVGARVVFVSSQTARENAPTLYGRTKAQIEVLVAARAGCSVRPGQVYGGDEKGLFGLLVNVVARLPVLPAFVPAPQVQPVHVDDLAEALLQVAQRHDLSGRALAVAAPDPLSFTAFLKTIGTHRLGMRRLFVPVPVLLVRAAVAVLGQERSDRLGLSRLLSLFGLPLMSSRDDLATLGLVLRPLQEGMRTDPEATDATDSALLTEGRVMLTYLLKRSPDAALLDRYVRAIKQCRDSRALALPGFVLRRPALLALLDDRAFLASPRGADFAWRLDAATLLAEATPAGASHYLGIGRPAGFFRYGLQLAGSVSMEIFWRLARAISMPLFLRAAIDRSFK
ncbi:NAD-dependent epimerase/dehydratase family protein [Herbaspirillum sp. DW155]|uniref:NAD-dependent epimerase/dehydratase family protein n=1 Tax=Herbaspirillum sp. DW155 TaxID=3095609 RepID=UPI003088F38F|nr:NAD-dependent epimerase/dehydratase family protein [Herbaspirillum sp. DW155]